MSVNTARRIAWFLVGIYIILMAVGLTLQAITGKPYVEEIGIPGLILILILVGSWPVTGALVLSRHPRHPVGWLMCLDVIVGSIDMFAAGYAAYDTYVVSGSLPGADLALIWLTVGGMPFGIMAFTLATLLFPVWRAADSGGFWRKNAQSSGIRPTLRRPAGSRG